MAPLTLVLCLLASDRPDLDARFAALADSKAGIALAGDYKAALQDCEHWLEVAHEENARLRAEVDEARSVVRAHFAAFELCRSGPCVPCLDVCRAWDFDGDGDVDQEDFGVLQREMR